MKYKHIKFLIILITSIICISLLIAEVYIYNLAKEYDKKTKQEFVNCVNENKEDLCAYEKCKTLHNGDGRINYQNMLELQYQNCLLRENAKGEK